MKALYFFLFLIFTFINIHCPASIRRTVCNGDWSNPEIWKNGQVPVVNDTILINHFVVRNSILSTQNNYIVISELGELCGQYDFIINAGSKVYNYGSICANEFEIHDSLINYGVIKATLIVVTVDNGYLSSTNTGSTSVGAFSCFGQASCTPLALKNGDTLVSNTEAAEYEWHKNNQSLNLNSIKIIPTHTGYYKLRIRKTNFEDFSNFSDSIYVVIESSSESISFQEKNSIEVSQDMENNLFKLSIKNPSESKYNIEIYNLLGLKIFNSTFKQNFIINLNKLHQGYYAYRISDGMNLKLGTFFVR
ncbi:MAG: hypothetical protein A2046_16400 [Bacteroidetes bacterium GWA2_30_7]|nr:MAG: hypothetical protein A2046_16400 [Bacteroidetes bacterium GWA2_30_7]